MPFTIKQLAKLSGVSTRTLRFYDELDLLKPAYYGDNQYRYYEEEQLLLLQQILFYRELDFPLQDIQQILKNDTFDKISSLKQHQSMLKKKQHRLNKMLKTIDKTILHLKGEITMNVEEFFDPIQLRNAAIQQEYDKYLIDKGILSQVELDEAWEKLNSWTFDEWEQFKGDGDKFYQKMTESMKLGLDSHSLDVQELVDKHYLLIHPLWPFNQTSYLKLAEAYQNDENFSKFCAVYDKNLLSYLVDAMKYYAINNLK